ncbi:hypothetical protein, partial [Xanthomonas translucens]|uniref:hypothetical protein n=1 Tax=Xanthomonas campestris pv. translucens TaxID=343 RepID=UPI001E61DE7C
MSGLRSGMRLPAWMRRSVLHCSACRARAHTAADVLDVAVDNASLSTAMVPWNCERTHAAGFDRVALFTQRMPRRFLRMARATGLVLASAVAAPALPCLPTSWKKSMMHDVQIAPIAALPPRAAAPPRRCAVAPASVAGAVRRVV